MAGWLRVLDLKSGSPWFKSSTLLPVKPGREAGKLCQLPALIYNPDTLLYNVDIFTVTFLLHKK